MREMVDSTTRRSATTTASDDVQRRSNPNMASDPLVPLLNDQWGVGNPRLGFPAC